MIRVGVTYGELRSTGYPSFSNTKHEVSLTAALEEGETARGVITALEALAKKEVEDLFGDPPKDASTDPLNVPYHRPE